MNPRKAIPLLLLLAAAGAGTWYWMQPAAIEKGRLRLYGNVDIREAQLAFNASEHIDRILVKEGEHVHENQLLAVLHQALYRAKVAEAEAQVEAKRQQLNKLLAGSRVEEIDKARAFGVMRVDDEGWIREFEEKPENPQPIPGRPTHALASMGIYVFNTPFLYEQLIRDADETETEHDFGKDIIPYAIRRYRVLSYRFRDQDTNKQGYWRDVGTVDAFWSANLELIGVTPELNLYDEQWPIWTYQEQLPPAKFVFDDEDRRGMAVDSMVSGGCIISGALVRHSLLFSNVKVHTHAHVEDSVVLPNVDIGRNCRIERAVIDKGCRIPAGMEIGVDPEADAERFHVTEGGVVLVTPEMLGQELHHVR